LLKVITKNSSKTIMKRLIVLRDSSFKKEVIESEIPVLIDFWASWCPPCKMIEPIIEELSQDLEGAVKITKINVDQNPTSASAHKIMGVPTFIIFKCGKEMGRRVGAQSKTQLMDMLKDVGIEI